MIWKTTIAKMFPFFNISLKEVAKWFLLGSVKQTGLRLIGLMMMTSLGMQGQNGNGAGGSANNIIVGDDCIVFDSCPADQSICAETYQDGVLGASVTWDTPVITQTCTGTGSSGNFQMLFELNEELLSQDCWAFNYIQRVGTEGGYVKLFSSNDALGTKQSIITTPYLVLNDGSETSIELNYDNGDYTVQLFLVDEQGNEYPSGGPTQVDASTTIYEFTTELPTGTVGVYRIKYVFEYTGSKPSNANSGDTVIAVNGILYDDGCSGGVDFTVTGPSQGFYPVGSHDLVYKATYTAPDGTTKIKTCSFNITVTALDLQITNVEDASCNTNADGSITAQASGVNGTGTEPFEYSINGTDFQPGGTFTGLSPGIYNITARDANGCTTVSDDVNVGAADTEAPVLTAPADDTEEGCNIYDITSLPYSETETEISLQEFEAIGGNVSDNGSIASISYQDSNNGAFPILVTRTFTVNDACGNSAQDTQTITIEDNTAPVADAASLPTVTGQCSATVSEIPTATDNCNGAINGTTTDPLSYSNQGTYTIVWTFTDSEGNSSTQNQTVIVGDTTAPVADAASLPTVTGQCNATVSDIPTATDNCNGTINGTTTDPLSYSNQGTYTIIWTFTDSEGNSSTQNQTVIVDDTTAPVADAASLPTINGQCSATVTDIPTATDNCNGSINGTTTDPLTYTEQGTYTIVWIFTDSEGNSSTQNQTVIIDDTTAPVADAASLPTVTGQCGATVSDVPTATDNCNGSINGTTTDPLTYSEQGTYTIIWTFTDSEGNSSTQNQTVIIDDTTAPVADAESLPTVTGQCNATVSDVPTATDNCNGSINGTTTDELTYTEQGTYTIVWTFTDSEGNSSTQNQTVIVDDTTAPVADAASLPTVTGQCNATVSNVPTATDNCNGSINGTTTDPLSYSEQGTYTIVWTFTDSEGNSSTQNQTVIIDDTTAPVADAASLPTVTGQCNATVSNVPTATDNCNGTINGTTTDEFTYTEQGTYTIVWTFTDSEGNSSTQNQTVIVDDTTAPEDINIPDAVGQCSVTVSVPTTQDNCEGEITGTTTDDLFYDQQGEYQVTWTFADGNGNSTEVIQKVIVDDTAAPSPISIPDANGECEVTVTVPVTTDDCSGEEITGTTTDPLTYTEQGDYQITWTFDDGNGNTTQAVQNVYVNDTTAPESIDIADASGECEVSVTAPTTQDNCEGEITGTTTDPLTYTEQGDYQITWTFDDGNGNITQAVQNVYVDDISAPETVEIADAIGECQVTVTAPTTQDNCKGEITGTTTDPLTYTEQGDYQITWTFDDENGNTTQAVQNVYVNDTTAPESIEIADATGECEVSVAAPTTQDNCEGEITGTTTDPLTYTEQGDFQITWTFDDGNGNTTQAVQNVYVNDTTAPESIEIADAVGQCSVNLTAPVTNDNCEGQITGTTNDPLFYDEQGEYEVTWTFDDGNGNITEVIQNVIVDDTAAPSPVVIPDAVAECEITVTTPVTTDDCSGEEITGTTTDPLTYTEQGEFQITWIFDDGNGNIIESVQNVIIDDNTAPESIEIADAIAECEVSLTAPATQDNCEGEITGTTEDPLTYTEQGEYQVTWTFDDGNGNTTQAVQNIYVNDTTAPENIEIPDATGECEVTVTAPTTQDNCTGEITGTTEDPLTYTEQGDYQITWTFDDGNGNTTQEVQNVFVKDTTAPESIEIADATGQCSVSIETPVTTDNCAGEITGTTEDALFYDQQGTYEVEWTFDDGNGNISVVVQTVIVDDTMAPAPIEIADAAGECEVNLSVPVTTDDCSGEEIVGTTTDPLTYTEQGEYQVTWTFDDGNGNITEVVQNVIVDDVTAPESIEIADATGECEVSVSAPTTQDSCEGEIIATTNDPLSYTEQGEYQVTWIFDDGNGNITEVVQNVIVDDVTAPESIEIADATGECEVSLTAPITQDNCAGEIIATTNDPLSYTEQGEYKVSWSFDDGNGNITQAVQNVIVNDVTAPESIQIADATGECEVSLTAPTTQDNCAGEITGTTEDPLTYTEQGEYQVSWSFDDGNGNITQAVQNVIVNDVTAPEFAEAGNIEMNVDAGQCGAIVNYEVPAASDNCGISEIKLMAGLEPGSEFPVGTTPVTYEVTDLAGNMASVSFNVIVTDNINPTIECRTNITTSVAFGESGTMVDYETPAYSDNCADATIEQTQGLASGSEFPVGTTANTFVVTDASGNTVSCSFSVTVNEEPAAPSVSVTQPDCDTPTGSISVETTAGLVYSIDGENYQESGSFAELAPGTYNITARDGNAYVSPATSVVINAQPSTPAAPVIEETLEPSCTDPTASIMLTLVDGISFSLETEDGSMITDEDEDGIFEGLTAGDYNVYAQNTEGCISEATSFSIEAPESSNIEEATVNLCIGDQPYDLFELFPEGNDLTGEWTDSQETGALTDNILDPALLEVGTYTFTYQTTGECATTTTITANIDDDCVEVLPCALEDISSSISKAVTPNGDGHNDYFEIDFANECGFVYDLMIFNRWGAKIFESNNYQNNWDGFSTDSFTSSDQLPSGTYYYVLEIRNSGFEPIQGYIYLGTK